MAIENGVVSKKFPDNPHLEGTRDEFIEKNMKLAYSVARKFYAAGNVNGIEPEEINSIAIVGLIKAYDKYDPTKFDGGVTKFSAKNAKELQGILAIRDIGLAPKQLNMFEGEL